jgi:hypothetical protein
MLEKLAIAVMFGALLPRGQDMPKVQPHAAQNIANTDKQPAPPANPVINASDCCKTETPTGPNSSQEKSSAWPLRPEYLIVWITIGYALISYFQLRAISRQADTMEEQAKDARTSAAAASTVALDTLTALKRQADVMEKQNKAVRDKERARITVIFPPEVPDFKSPSRLTMDDEPELWMELFLAVHNDGLSKAFNVRAWGGMIIQNSADSVAIGEKGWLNFPSVIREATLDDPIRFVVSQILLDREVNMLASDPAFFFVYGEISYEDVFGDKHRTPFRYLWSVDQDANEGEEFDLSCWENQSPPST